MPKPEVAKDTVPSLVDALAQVNAQPLWDRYMRMLTLEPKSPDASMLWSWAALQPMMERAVREVPMDDAERRVLLLGNPAFAPHSYTTTNLQAGLQILEPGEYAAPHRHTVAALRFVMEGSGATTWVNGKACAMQPGDLILTPSWCWHEHRNEGAERVVWFDGLDVPFVHGLSSAFLQFGPPRDVPAQVDDTVAQSGLLPASQLATEYRRYSPRYRYEAAAVAAALTGVAPEADGARLLRYVNPATGGAVMPTLDCYALGLQKGAQTRAHRTTSNAVAVVVRGEGVSSVGDRRIAWKKNDVFTLPHWNWISHKALQPGTQLFLMTDQCLLDAAGYLFSETET